MSAADRLRMLANRAEDIQGPQFIWLCRWAADAADALAHYHEWLELYDDRAQYLGLDHKIGERTEGCDACALLARLDDITGDAT